MTPDDLWSNERLVYEFDRLDRRLIPMESLLPRLEVELHEVGKDAADGKAAVDKLAATFDERRREETKERKANFRWALATGGTALTLILAALGLILGQ